MLAHPLSHLNLNEDQLERTLGIKWDIKNDKFVFSAVEAGQPYTKRGILKTVSSIFDPLGFLSPFTMRAKCILQDLWRLKVDWDAEIDSDIKRKWNNWLKELQHITSFCLPRCYIRDPANVLDIQLHMFSDASELAFGAVGYIRIRYGDGKIYCALVASKSRVAPLKQLTMPRLELQGAVLSVRLSNVINEELCIKKINQIHYWVDSMIVLQYIANETRRFKVFVGNRVAEIRETSFSDQWHHIDGTLNPADCATRGSNINDITGDSVWLTGPKFLYYDEAQWPQQPTIECVDASDEEVKQIALNSLLVTDQGNVSLTRKYSSWSKTLRVMAWVLRFINSTRTKQKPNKNYLTVSELKQSEHRLVIMSQIEDFNEEIVTLSKGLSLSSQSRLLSLRPFLDQKGALRVGGRIKHADVPFGAKHQLILAKDAHISLLLVRHEHLIYSGLGPEALISSLRQRYWVIGARRLVKGALKNCMECKRRLTKPVNPLMADLPDCRLAIASPCFYYTGVDYFGPLSVKVGRAHHKRWGCLFTCMTTRAVHMEVVESLDTSSFINTLQRFINRRGHPKTILSDCGSNFKGADRELKKCLVELKQDVIGDFAARKDIEWRFNPPDVPPMGTFSPHCQAIPKSCPQGTMRNGF